MTAAVRNSYLVRLSATAKETYLVAAAVGAVLFADTSAWGEKVRNGARRWMFPAGLALIVTVLAMSRPDSPSIDIVIHPPHSQTLLALGFLAMVLGLWETNNRLVVGFFSYGPFRYLGRISYGLYLIHLFMWPLVDWLTVHFPPLGAVPPLVARFGLTVLLAACMWHFVEAPILKLKARFP